MASLSSFSDALGYASIGCWLGAQFPQVLENHRRRSVEGLAWPFLANWLAGDMSNLVGCILTHQLPFQTYLAIYFCFVDVTLVGQYLYYRANSKPTPYPGRARTTSTATLTRRLSIERPPTHYRALSNVAANVAAAAALAAQQEEHTRWRSHHQHSVESRHSYAPAEDEDEDEVDEAALARLTESFHSDGGRSTRQKRVSWSTERSGRGGSLGRTHTLPALSPVTRTHPTLPFPTSPILRAEDPAYADRGRPVARDGGPLLDEAQHEWAAESSAQRRSSRASRKGAGMVFLAFWAFFSVGNLLGSRSSVIPRGNTQLGHILVRDDIPVPVQSDSIPLPHHDDTLMTTSFGQSRSPSDTISYDQLQFADEIPPSDGHPETNGPSTDYIIGRISAWICTTLYLTSRLPQIWKNYCRKSVEGLAMSLFVFAFLGNLLYVSSILTSPKLSLPEPEASAFLRETVPYLLGSGGTLMFDVTIVTQSFLYRPKSSLRGRPSTRTLNEEEEGLLSAGATGAEEIATPSRRRMATSNEVGE